jgi:hypothetical protein
MAFCNSCGTTLTPGTRFCNKCGAAAALDSSVPAPVAPPPAGSSALKVVLIVIAVIIGLGILGVAAVGFVGYHFVKHAHVTQNGDHVRVETPLGTFSANDPDQAVKDLGVDVYPGAEAQKDGSASATIGSIRTVTANFHSSDSPDKVCDFYKAKFPTATVTSADQGRCTIVSTNQNNSITINVDTDNGITKIAIASVNKNAASGSTSN